MATLTTEQPDDAGNFLDRLGKTLAYRPYYHAVGWLILLVTLVLMDLRFSDFPFATVIASQSINLLFYMVVVYINLMHLFPNYLRKGKYWRYLLLLLGLTLMITPIKLVTKFIIFSGNGVMQADILDNMDLYFLSMFFVLCSSTVGKIMVDWVTQNRKKVRVENESMQSELRFLKSQINPHFLFNTLNSLYALTLKKDDKAPDIVIKLSEMMRYMLYECNEPRVPLRKEINYLKNYLDLERLRQRKGIEIKLDVSGSVSDQMVAPLLLIPFLENSFKHGVNAAIQDGFVHARLRVENRSIHFELENSKGSVMPTQVHGNRPSGGIGLVNVRRRLQLLYPDAYDLSVEETPNTYTVRLDLDLAPPQIPGLPLRHELLYQGTDGTRAFHP